MSDGLRISVVVPIHNEAGYLPEAVPDLVGEIEPLGVPFEVILAENGSIDGTVRVARDLADRDARVRVLSLPEPNYGAAMRAGFREATGEWVVNFDIDYFSGAFLGEVLALADSADLVLASKRVPGSDDRRGTLRRMGTLVFNLLLRALFRSKVSDTHGMKAVRREVVGAVVPFVVSTLDLFDTELVIRAERAGYRIREIPAVVEELREARSSFLSRVPRTIVGLVRIRLQLWRER
ncbi:MAG TPA: glycosyltransferase family 2 protein [Acidimicrobiia bacterium]|nr:glycosyltransferase family 2 protein [Acidimicrobiia bacterium]